MKMKKKSNKNSGEGEKKVPSPLFFYFAPLWNPTIPFFIFRVSMRQCVL